LADLEAEMKSETDAIQADFSPESLKLEEATVQPKKSEINVSQVALVWLPS